MRSGHLFPPVRIRLDPRTGTFSDIDGSHRTAASVALGFTDLPTVTVPPVVSRTALLSVGRIGATRPSARRPRLAGSRRSRIVVRDREPDDLTLARYVLILF
jgi:hypothetical protein